MTEQPHSAGNEVRGEGLYRQPWLLGGAAAVVMILVFALGAMLGYGLGLTTAPAAYAQSAPPSPESAGVTATPTSAVDPRADLEVEMDLFWDAMDHLYDTFDGALPSGRAATYGAIRGVVDLLEDPNTTFLDPDEAALYQQSIEGGSLRGSAHVFLGTRNGTRCSSSSRTRISRPGMPGCGAAIWCWPWTAKASWGQAKPRPLRACAGRRVRRSR